MTGLEYDTNIEIALNSFKAVRDQLNERVVSIEEELEGSEPWRIGYEPEPNLIDMVRALTVRIQTVQELGAIHRFAKLDETQRDRLFAGQNVHRVVGTAPYTITQWDTPQSISDKFGVPWRDIALYNEITALDFIAGLDIEIPLAKDDGGALAIFEKNPVYDAHIGMRALGSDLANEITASEDGDLANLDNAKTFVQGLQNIIKTARGEVAGHPNWGLNDVLNEDMPAEAKERFVEYRVRDALSQEPRIEQVVSVTVEKQSSGYNVGVVVKPINHPEAEEFIDALPFRDEE